MGPIVTPGGAAGPFGPAVTVVQADCEFETATGGCAVDREGTIHAFIAFADGSCGADPIIQYVNDSDETWSATVTSCRGAVRGLAIDGSRPFLLYSNRDGVHITAREADGQVAAGRRISHPSLLPMQVGGGSVVAKNDRWWAVWIEKADPRMPFKLFHASTMASGGERPREQIRTTVPDALHSTQPTLALDPADPGGAVLAWTVVTKGGANAVRFARARTADARWHEQAWVPEQPENTRLVGAPHLSAADGELHGTYEDNNTIVHALDPPAGAVSHNFRTPGNNPRVAHSAGRTFVAWTVNERLNPTCVSVGEVSSAGVAGEWILHAKGVGQREELLGLVARAGKPTVLGVNYETYRLWAQSPA